MDRKLLKVFALTVAVLLDNFMKQLLPSITSKPARPKSFFVGAADELDDVLFCPYVTTCIHEYSAHLADSSDGNQAPCCRPCGQCEEYSQNCGRMSCCSDIMPCENAILDLNNRPLVCIRSNVDRDKPIPGLMAVASCKPGSDEGERAKCVQRYNMTTADVHDILPVSEINSHHVYRNIHCALCNGIEKDNTVYWSLNVYCDVVTNIDVTETSQVLKAVLETNECDVRFTNPFPETPVEQCSFVIDRCNVTGLLTEEYSNLREEKNCLNPPYSFAFSKQETMIFIEACTLCNGMQTGAINNFFDGKPSMSVTLALDSSTKTVSSNEQSCAPGMLYHKTKRICLEARCSALRRLRRNVCEKTIPEVDSWTYKLGLRLKPESRITVGNAFSATSEVIAKLRGLLGLVFGTVPLILYEIVLVSDVEYMYQTDDEIRNAEIFEADLLWYEGRILLHSVDPHNPEDKLDSLLTKMLSNKVIIASSESVTVFKIVVKDDLVYFTRKQLDRVTLQSCHYTITDASPCMQFYPNVTFKAHFPTNATAVPFIGNNSLYAGEIFYDISIDKGRNILEYRECPFLKVSKRDKVWTETEQGLEFLNEGLSLNSSDFVYGEHAEEIWVCLEKYNMLFNSGATNVSRSICAMNLLLIIVCIYF